MITRPSPRPSDRRSAPAGVDACLSILRRMLTSGATTMLFALGPLGAGLAIANGQSAPATLAKQRYVARTDRICAASSSQVNDVLRLVYPGAPHGDMLPGERDVWVVQHVAPIIRAEIAALRSVPAPEGDEAKVRAIYDAMERSLATVERDPAAFRLFGQSSPDDPFAAPAQLAGDYGLSVCALGSPDAE